MSESKREVPSTPPAEAVSAVQSAEVTQEDKRSPIQQLIGSTASDTTLNERLGARIKLHLRFGPHGHAGNFSALPDLLRDKGVQVYCYENSKGPVNNTAYTLCSTIRYLSPDVIEANVDAALEDGRPARGTPTEMQIRALAGTGIKIGHFDLNPAENPDRCEAINNLTKVAEKKLSEFGETFDQTLQLVLSAAGQLADLIKERDGVMLGPATEEEPPTAGQFEKEMDRILTLYPELKELPEVVVVDTHGSGHTSMFHRARAAGVAVERSFSDTPYVYRPTLELARKIGFGKEPTREFMIQCLVDEGIRKAIDSMISLDKVEDDPDIVRYIRIRSAGFNEAEAQELFKVMKKEQGTDMPLRTVDAINAILHEKGLGPLPQTQEELYEDIARQKAAYEQKKERIIAEDAARKAAAARAKEHAQE